jgi:methylthioribose-1-phosphate isomerase
MTVKTLVALTPTIEWKNDQVRLIDQTKLPLQEEYIETDDTALIAMLFIDLAIRGAPAIGVAGAYACVLQPMKLKNVN